MGAGGPSGREVLLGAVRGQRRDVIMGALLGAGHQAGEVLVPVLIGVVIDRSIAKADAGAMFRWIAVLALVYIGLSFSYRFAYRSGERAGEKAAHVLRLQLVDRVLDPAGGAESGRLPGALVNIATDDARRVGDVNQAVMYGVAALAGLAISAFVLLRISLPLGLLVLLCTPALLWLAHRLSKPFERRSEAEQEHAGHASGVAADLVAGLRVLKGLGSEPAAVARYRRASGEALTATLRAARAEAWQSGVMLAMTGILVAAVALVGGRLTASGDMTLGQLVSAVGVALFLLGPLAVFSWVIAELAQGRASATRIASVLAAPPAVAGGGPMPGEHGPVQGRVKLRWVSYGTLRQVNLEVEPGEVVGVVTTDPADAAALLQCLNRSADPEEGSVELDGIALTELSPATVRDAVLVADHNATLFEGTFIGNVADAAPETADLEFAMAVAGADEIVRSLPQGGETPVGDRGHTLSGGQQQRVALARALAADPPVLVLHDPTTAVDAVTEARIADGLRRIRAGRSTIVVTTSPALLAVTDRVVLIDRGAVADAAPHADLVRRHESYRAAVLA